MRLSSDLENRRILLIDDNSAIHEDFRKILSLSQSRNESMEEVEAVLFGASSDTSIEADFTIDSAYQGREGLAMVKDALGSNRPYALAFVDMRMPPGWDGLETIENLWSVAPDLQIVICTAYSDNPWEKITERLGQSDQLLILKKPFDNIEFLQLASALLEKWNLAKRARLKMDDLERMVRERTQELEKANQAKSEFLANMSHELRTPMNAVIGFTELLLDTDLVSQQQEYAEIVRKSSDTLLSLINDILDISKIEARQLDLESIDFNLPETIEEVVNMLSLSANQKCLRLSCKVSPDVPRFLRGDVGRLRQILINLINNAIKFTEKGSVDIAVNLEESDESSAKIGFIITDTGIGIPEDSLSRIFEAFSQVDSSSTRNFGGTGLGLAISKELAELMGGSVHVESTESEGSCFSLSVVLEKQREVTKPVPLTLPRKLQGKRVLLLDDNTLNRTILAKQLENLGCMPEEACSAMEAFERICRSHVAGTPIDVLITDMQMPDMDGETLGRKIKGDDRLKDTELIMVTSMERKGDFSRLMRIGFAAYLTKPIKQADLYACLSTVLGQPGTGRESHDSGIVTSATITESNLEKFRILVVDDSTFNRKFVEKILEKLGHNVSCASDGVEAVEACETGHFDLVLMDCQMPRMNGYQATAAIRKHEDVDRRIPIIAMTAHAMKGDREKCLAVGMNDYISKPLALRELKEVLGRWTLIASREVA